MSKSYLLVTALALAAAFAPIASACAQDQAVSPRATVQADRAHEGFFLRLMVGTVGGGTHYRAPNADGRAVGMQTVGAGGLTEIAVGYGVFENLALHATLQLSYVDGLKRERRKSWDDDREAGTLVGFFGGGLTYYLMPTNVYLTASVGAGGLSELHGEHYQDFESDAGLATSFGLGKEWRISHSDWGLGAALAGTYYRAPFSIDGVHSTFRGYTAGAAFSASYF